LERIFEELEIGGILEELEEWRKDFGGLDWRERVGGCGGWRVEGFGGIGGWRDWREDWREGQ
jgi:hypothetical protein